MPSVDDGGAAEQRVLLAECGSGTSPPGPAGRAAGAGRSPRPACVGRCCPRIAVDVAAGSRPGWRARRARPPGRAAAPPSRSPSAPPRGPASPASRCICRVSRPTTPKSSSASTCRPPSRRMFPGCGSPWNSPSSKSWRKRGLQHVLRARAFPRAPGRARPRHLHPAEVLQRQHRAAAQLVVDPGDADVRALPVVLLERADVLRPRGGSPAPRGWRGRTRRRSRWACRCRSPRPPPRAASPGERSTEGPSAICSAMPGRCTFTTTSSPPAVTARCTWAMDAAASGCGSIWRTASRARGPAPRRICCAHLLQREGRHRVLEQSPALR